MQLCATLDVISMKKLLSLKELEELNLIYEKLLDERTTEEPRIVKEKYIALAKKGSGSACLGLACGYDIHCKLYPDQFNNVFIKERRRAKRYCNRALKCFRREAESGNYGAMFTLSSLHASKVPRMNNKNRNNLIEFWLRKAAKSGKEIPVKAFEAFLEYKND